MLFETWPLSPVPLFFFFVYALCALRVVQLIMYTYKVMDASGQTVEERRQLRLEQRNLKNQIIEQQAVRGREGGRVILVCIGRMAGEGRVCIYTTSRVGEG